MIVNKTSSSNKKITDATIIPKDLCYHKIAYGNNGKVIGEAPYNYTPHLYEFEQIKEGAWEVPVEFKDKLFTFIPDTTQAAYYDFKTKIWNYYNTDFTLYKNAIGVSNDMIIFLHTLDYEYGKDVGTDLNYTYKPTIYYYSKNGIEWNQSYFTSWQNNDDRTGALSCISSSICETNGKIFLCSYPGPRAIQRNVDGEVYILNNLTNNWEILTSLQMIDGIRKFNEETKIKAITIKDKYIIFGHFFGEIYNMFNNNYLGSFQMDSGSESLSFAYYDDINKKIIFCDNVYNYYSYFNCDLNAEMNDESFECVPINIELDNYNLFYYSGNYIATSNSSNANSFYYSTNLENWETINTPFEITSTSKVVFKDNNIYFISNNTVYQSSNYTNWNQSILSNGNWQILKDENEIEYLVTDSKFAYYSNNGWVEINLPIISNWKEIKIFRDNYFLFSNNKVLISQDLNNWGTQYRLNIYNHRIENGITAISAENAQSRELVVNNIQQTLTNNLPTYSEYTMESILYSDAIFHNDIYIIHGTSTAINLARSAYAGDTTVEDLIFYSQNGIYWEQVYRSVLTYNYQSGSYDGINKIIYFNNKFYALNYEFAFTWTSLSSSQNGKNWNDDYDFNPSFSYESQTSNCIQTNSKKYIDLIKSDYGYNGLRYSYDLENWNEYTNINYIFEDEMYYTFNLLAYNKNNNVTVAITSDSIFTSLDTETWTSQVINPTNYFNKIECHNGIFIINCENSDSVYISEDGLNWELTNQNDYRVWKAYNGIQINGNQTKINKTVLRFKDEATIIPVENISNGDYSPYNNNTICISYTN